MASATNATLRSSIEDEFTHASLILEDMIIPAVYSATVMDPLITVRDISGMTTDTAVFPIDDAIAAASVAETSDLANTEIVPTKASIAAGEIGVMTSVSDVVQEDDIFANLDHYADQLARALADKWDADAAALLAGFSNTTDSGGTDAANALVLTDFLLALRDLESRDAEGPWNAVLHPVQYNNLAIDIHENGGAIWGGDAPQDARIGQRRAFKGELLGTDVYTSTNVPTATVNTNDVYSGAIFSKMAIARTVKRRARVELDRDASFRLTEIVVTGRYGVGELVDDWGQTIRSDQTATGVGA